jgi:adenine-specific DNA-methyltransferase
MTRGADVTAHARVPYRMLEAAPSLDGGDGDPSNMLIQGDNLEALKALLPFYAGRVKCIYIDPPYNTRSAFEHYDDNLEHAQWLAMITPRIVLLRELLAEDGSIWVSIDDNEGHYLKVLMDEVFGRQNFVADVAWQSKDTPGNDATTIAQTHNSNFVYRRSDKWSPNRFPRTAKQRANYKNPDKDPRGDWLGTPLTRAEHRDRDVY